MSEAHKIIAFGIAVGLAIVVITLIEWYANRRERKAWERWEKENERREKEGLPPRSRPRFIR